MCQIIFINTPDISSGNVRFDSESNKRGRSHSKTAGDVVGVSMRYFDASLSFVTCSLGPTDIAHRAIDLDYKHRSATHLVDSFSIDHERASIDFPYLYHHTFLCGNFNFDMKLPRYELVNQVELAYKAECLRVATDIAIDARMKASQQMDGALTRNGAEEDEKKGSTLFRRGVAESNSFWSGSGVDSPRRMSGLSLMSGDESHLEYHEVYTSGHNGDVAFTALRSPESLTKLNSASSAAVTLSNRGEKKRKNHYRTHSGDVKLSVTRSILEEDDVSTDSGPANYPRYHSEYVDNGLHDFLDFQLRNVPSPFHSMESSVNIRSTGSSTSSAASWMNRASSVSTRSCESKVADLIAKSVLTTDHAAKHGAICCSMMSCALPWRPKNLSWV